MDANVQWRLILRHFAEQFVKLISTLKAFNLQSHEKTILYCIDNTVNLAAPLI